MNLVATAQRSFRGSGSNGAGIDRYGLGSSLPLGVRMVCGNKGFR